MLLNEVIEIFQGDLEVTITLEEPVIRFRQFVIRSDISVASVLGGNSIEVRKLNPNNIGYFHPHSGFWMFDDPTPTDTEIRAAPYQTVHFQSLTALDLTLLC